MAHFFERLGSRSGRRLLFAGLTVIVIGLFALGLTRKGGADAGPATEQSMVVARAPFVLFSNFAGRIVPGERFDVTAPFDARVERLRVAYGDRVEAGQPLIELNFGDARRGRAQAEIALLRAEADSERMRNWEQGPEVSRAERAVEAAEADLSDTQSKLDETRSLLDRGLVPRSEHDALMQQRRQRQAALVAARDDLKRAIARGQDGERRIALLQREVAHDQYVETTGVSGGIVRAAGTGVLVRPDEGGAAEQRALHAGARVAEGQLLGVIASTTGLDVIFKLDEADLALVKPGQKAMVSGPGFGGSVLAGMVSSIGGEAETAAGGGKATFEARIRLDPLSEPAAREVRIGMTANIAIMTYENRDAITVPPQAVLGGAPQAHVLVRARSGSASERRAVTIGKVGPSAVEILSGLRAGETVVWAVAPPQAP